MTPLEALAAHAASIRWFSLSANTVGLVEQVGLDDRGGVYRRCAFVEMPARPPASREGREAGR